MRYQIRSRGGLEKEWVGPPVSRTTGILALPGRELESFKVQSGGGEERMKARQLCSLQLATLQQ